MTEILRGYKITEKTMDLKPAKHFDYDTINIETECELYTRPPYSSSNWIA
ncbi:hypothetical protein [Aquibacillus albus]|uniref:Uncharacterized protein n=1 Tax=Aquibacillus albus TaxID=1168171 RepID=A0ABS2MZX8_9BACI|nr:hypothetical protein [Aquibacillus albus]MBM7571396.1 hypothetical protein [Aquibacillus albus]